jgi:hypothetical protein
MSKKLFLDYFRFPLDIYPELDENEFDIVRSYDDFVDYISKNGVPDFISFDNDLGFDVRRRKISLSGFEAAKWLVEQSGFNLKGLTYKVHSSDPNAEEKITELLKKSIDTE